MSSRIRHIVAAVLGAALVIGVTGFLPIVAPAYACACGAFAPPDGTTGDAIHMNSEASIITLSADMETIEMRLGVDAITPQTGLIFPTPAPAKASLGDVADFTALGAEMTPERRKTYDWWAWPSFGLGAAAPGSAADGGAPEVLEQVQLGPIEATTLAASDAEGLQTWLDANGYGLRPEVSSLLQRYVAKGWYFVAFKLTGASQLDGELDPLRITFAASELVYPLALSQAATSTQYVFLYVFSDHRVDVSFADGAPAGMGATWARTVRDPSLRQNGAYLTALSGEFYDPGSQITDDLVIHQAATDDEVGTIAWDVEHVRLWFIPAGWALVSVGLGLVVAAGFTIWNLSRRRRQVA